MHNGTDYSIIALDKFIQSTRDSGYKSTGSAVAELVDNAVEAGAKNIDVTVCALPENADHQIVLSVSDDGDGMAPNLLRGAMRFGGSSRFNNRNGLGRFGMGLPNASLSQSRRVQVFSWQGSKEPRTTYLDVDEIAAGHMVEVPEPMIGIVPAWVPPRRSKAGTVVVLDRCDRIDYRKVSTIEKKLADFLGRVFRYFIWSGTRIRINGEAVEPFDPLFIRTASGARASQFQESLKFEVYANPAKPQAGTGYVTVTFSELPIAEWQDLSNDEKRALGIANAAGVSIVRGQREVDFGWFFMGAKRRENYDDWWRCEITFDPILDEAFGITHTKQQIKPNELLNSVLQPHVETIAKALNGRVRQAHLQLKTNRLSADAEHRASSKDEMLRPLPSKSALTLDGKDVKRLLAKNKDLRDVVGKPPNGQRHYRLIASDPSDGLFFKPAVANGTVLGLLSPAHRFFKDVYQPLLDGKTSESQAFAFALQMLLLSAARAEAMLTNKTSQQAVAAFRREWSEALDVMLSPPRN